MLYKYHGRNAKSAKHSNCNNTFEKGCMVEQQVHLWIRPNE